MKHLKPFNESEDWKKYEIEGKMKKSLKSKLPLLGLKVRRKGRKKFEEGTIVIDSFDGKELEYFIMFKEDDMEQLLGLPFQYWNETLNKWEDENFSGKEICFELTDEEKEFLNIYQNLPFKSFKSL